MAEDTTEFREDLRWNSYFVDGVYDKIKEEVQLAANQFEEANDITISDDTIEKITDDIVNNGLNSLADDNDTE